MRITTQRSVRGTNALLAVVLGVSMLVLAWGISVGNVYVAIFVGVVAALCFVLVGTVNLVPDDSRSEATERTLRVAVGTLEHLRGGLTADNAPGHMCASAARDKCHGHSHYQQDARPGLRGNRRPGLCRRLRERPLHP